MGFDEYIKRRIEIFDRLYAEQQEKEAKQERKEIKVETKFGTHICKSYDTTPFMVSKILNPGHKELLIAKVNGILWDVHRPLESDCAVTFLDFSDEEGKKVFWHSSAHVLGEACEKHFSCNLCLGPPTDSGFFYEMEMKRTVVPEDYPHLQREMKAAVNEKQKFLRLEMKKKDLLDMFSDNPLKIELIKEKVNEKSTVYRCGPLIDFCLGPHIPCTSYIKTIEVVNHSSSFFLGDLNRPVLQRVYGISFPTKQEMREYKEQIEEAKKNNHRKIGADLDLFFFSSTSPGSCFFLPNGAFIYNSLISLMKEHYRRKGFKEVITPNVFSNELWKTSGHWEKYKDDMFCFEADNTEMALKPMNCPGHCLLFKHLSCSYRELPLRLADFGVLHRNEISGSLTGLTRVRRFQQDDAHIFVSASGVAEEIKSALDFLKEIYQLLGFTYTVSLSTRPDNYIGDIQVWNRAEEQLREALDASNLEWALNEGDGAFYGPKIDISISDALKRKHQCGTIQLDFQMPERFNLSFRNADGQMERPVMVHRAILGSVERMISVLIEHFKGKLPPWLNPHQVAIIPVTQKEFSYAQEISSLFSGLEVTVNLSESSTLSKKVLNAQKMKYSFILVVGPRDAQKKTVSIRGLPAEVSVISAEKAAAGIINCVRDRRVSNECLSEYLKQSYSVSLPPSITAAAKCLERILIDIKNRALQVLRIK